MFDKNPIESAELFLACYVRSLVAWEIIQCTNIKSKTINIYMGAVYELFRFKGVYVPKNAHLKDPKTIWTHRPKIPLTIDYMQVMLDVIAKYEAMPKRKTW